MPFEAHFKVGGMVIRVFSDDLRKLVEDAAVIGDLQEKAAGRPNLAFFHRRPKGFNYYGVRDLDTGEELVFGQMKETFELFLRREQQFAPPFSGSGGDNPGTQQGGYADDPGTTDHGTPPPQQAPAGPPPAQRTARPAAPPQQPARPPAAAPPPRQPPAQRTSTGAPPTQRRW